MKKIFTFKTMILALALSVGCLILESCQSKPGCGTKRQHHQRNNRAKKSTSFMTY